MLLICIFCWNANMLCCWFEMIVIREFLNLICLNFELLCCNFIDFVDLNCCVWRLEVLCLKFKRCTLVPSVISVSFLKNELNIWVTSQFKLTQTEFESNILIQIYHSYFAWVNSFCIWAESVLTLTRSWLARNKLLWRENAERSWKQQSSKY
jgi:hypothetical protein